METFLFITIAVFIDVLFPGPNFVITSSIARKEGPKQALKLLAGILTACLIWCIFLFLGASFLFAKYPVLKTVIKTFGFLYVLRLSFDMIYINLKGLMKKNKENQIENNTNIKIPNKNYFSKGFITCILNPELSLFYMAMFARIFDAYGANNLIIMLYSFEFLLIQFVCFGFFIFIFSKSKTLDERFMRYFDLFLAILLGILLARLGKGLFFEIAHLFN